MRISIDWAKHFPTLLSWFSVALFAMSMFFDSFYVLSGGGTNSQPAPYLPPGILVLIGFFGLVGLEFLSWLANPLMFLTWLFLKEKRGITALCTSFASLVLALTFLRAKSIPDGNGFSQTIVGYGAGYWLWISSMVVGILASLVISIFYSKK